MLHEAQSRLSGSKCSLLCIVIITVLSSASLRKGGMFSQLSITWKNVMEYEHVHNSCNVTSPSKLVNFDNMPLKTLGGGGSNWDTQQYTKIRVYESQLKPSWRICIVCAYYVCLSSIYVYMSVYVC